MIIRNLQDIRSSANNVKSENNTWESARMLLKKDGMGFSFHVTTLYAGSEIEMQYLNHLEAVLILQGSGTIENLKSKETHRLFPGVMYALNEHDHHVLKIEEQIVCACVFNPPVTGQEVHDENGSYPAHHD